VDASTGLQYLRSRYYESGTGSFITQDTYTGSLGLDPGYWEPEGYTSGRIKEAVIEFAAVVEEALNMIGSW